MSRTAKRRRLLQALCDGGSSLTPLGTCKAKENGNSLYGLLPDDQVVAEGIEKGDELVIGYDAETSTFLITPADSVRNSEHWAHRQLRAVEV